jgi:uncharacterized membrane protein
MTFANPLPWWALILLVAAAGFLAYRAYANPVVPMQAARRHALIGLRFVTLILLILFLLRPVAIEPVRGPRDAVVPVLVDTSRSMRLADGEGRARIEQAAGLLQGLLPALTAEFQVQLLTFGEGVAAGRPDALSADARRSDLTGALRAVRERFKGQKVAGVVVLSDGGDTGGRDAAATVDPLAAPVYTIGIGASQVLRDREVLGVTAGVAALADSVVELSASVVSHGYGTEPFGVRVLENGRPIQVRRVTPAEDGSPVREVFQVSPKRDAATLYAVEVSKEASELAPENNTRSILVPPPGRRRRILVVQGAPGFEHSFLMRALAHDQGIEVDSVVRKGQNDRGEDTFYVQASAGRTAALAAGYPGAREALFAYDAIVLANVDADAFTRDQLAATAAFVSERGGGLLVLGARSFAQRSFSDTSLEEVLPVELTDRTGGVVRTAAGPAGEPNKLALTSEGEDHPITRLGASAAESRGRWADMPALAGSAALGSARAGATILAVTAGPGGLRPLVAVQRYGRGRAMVFAGEASWRWRMLRPSEDRTYETFWRQAARWLSSESPDPVDVTASSGAMPGDTVTLDVTARDEAFVPLRDATVSLHLTGPGLPGERLLETVLEDPAAGRSSGQFKAEQPGVYRVRAEARRKDTLVGTSDQWILVGGADLELADPRLNDEVLRRVALASGGRFLTAAEASGLPALLQSRAADEAPPRYRDLWNTAWAFAAIILLLGSEWVLRRRAGLK